jgi:hypothetical protein
MASYRRRSPRCQRPKDGRFESGMTQLGWGMPAETHESVRGVRHTASLGPKESYMTDLTTAILHSLPPITGIPSSFRQWCRDEGTGD